MPPCHLAATPPTRNLFGMRVELDRAGTEPLRVRIRHRTSLECAQHWRKTCARHQTSRTSCTRVGHETSRTCWRHFRPPRPAPADQQVGQGHHFGEPPESLESSFKLQMILKTYQDNSHSKTTYSNGRLCKFISPHNKAGIIEKTRSVYFVMYILSNG